MQLDLLRDYLGGLDDDSLSQLAAFRGWQTVTRDDGTKMMEIRKQEATIKPKKILAKIDFDSELSPIKLFYHRRSVLSLPIIIMQVYQESCPLLQLGRTYIHSLLVCVLFKNIKHYYEII